LIFRPNDKVHFDAPAQKGVAMDMAIL